MNAPVKHHLTTMLYLEGGWSSRLRRAETYNARQPFFICSHRNLKHDVFRSVACLLKLPIILFLVASQNGRQYLSVWYQKMHHKTYLKLFRLYVKFFQITGEPTTRWPEMNRFTVIIKLAKKCTRNPNKRVTLITNKWILTHLRWISMCLPCWYW